MTAPRDAEDTTAQFNRLHAFRHFTEFENGDRRANERSRATLKIAILTVSFRQ